MSSLRENALDGKLVGRHVEVDRLRREQELAASGSTRMVFVEGPAGIGKTALIDAFAAWSAGAGAAVLRVSCDRSNISVGYDAVERLFDFEKSRSPGAALSLPQRLHRTVAERSAAQPMILIVDDAQWCDESSLMWLSLLVRRGSEMPVLVVLSQRSSGLPRWRQEVLGAGLAQEARFIILSPLNDDDAAVLASRFWPARENDFVQFCNARCGGNPSLLLRLFRRLQEEGRPADATGRRRAGEIGAGLGAEYLVTVLDGLPPYVRKVAEAEALLGYADPELVAMIGGVPERLVPDALELLRTEAIAGADDGEFRRHTRSAVLSALSSDELSARRTLTARLLNDAGGSVREISAHLMLLPSLGERWMLYALWDASYSAKVKGDLATAERLLRRLLDEAPSVVEVRAKYAGVIAQTDPHTAHAVVLAALEFETDVRVRAKLAVQLAKTAMILGRAPEAVGLLTRVRAELGRQREQDREERDRQLLTRVESALLAAGWSDESTVPVTWELAGQDRPAKGHTRAEREVLAMSSLLSAMVGSSREVATAQALQALRGEETPADVVFGSAACALYLAGEVGEAFRAIDRVIAHCGERNLPWSEAQALTMRSWLLLRVGDLTGAMSDAERAFELEEEIPGLSERVVARVALAVVLVQKGEPETARELTEGVAQESPVWWSSLSYPAFLMLQSKLRLTTGDQAGALDSLLRARNRLVAAGISNPTILPWWFDAALLLTRMDRVAEAHEVVEYGEDLVLRWGSASGRGLALLARGVITEGAAGIELLRAAVEVLADAREGWYQMRSELLLGRALLRGHDKPAARRHFHRANDLAVQGGFRSLSELARRRLVAAGGRMYQDNSDVLTSGERRVAELAVAGATNREIAEALVIALRTVEIHLTSVYRKLRVTGRTGLPAALRDHLSGHG